jgi:hypothetical protein
MMTAWSSTVWRINRTRPRSTSNMADALSPWRKSICPGASVRTIERSLTLAGIQSSGGLVIVTGFAPLP